MLLQNKRIDIHNDWYNTLREYIESDEFTAISKFLKNEAAETKIYPPGKDIFRAFQLTSLKDLKVVVVGQDPYPNEYRGEPVACGLSFAPRHKDHMPPSLRNIYHAIKTELYGEEDDEYLQLDIEDWARQGVLMLNTALTVRAGQPKSHLKLWENWTLAVIKAINDYSDNVNFCLWGADAQKLANRIGGNHFVLTEKHPVAAAYQGGKWECSHFRIINHYLWKYNKDQINWLKRIK